MRSTNRVSFHNLFSYMSQSLDLPKDITSFYFWCKIQVLFYMQMKSASHTSIITALKFTCCSSLSVSYQQNCFILRTVHNHLWTRVPTHLCNRIYLLLSLVQMSLLYEHTLLCCHHCFKFSGNDRLRNRDGDVRTCCWTLVTVKLCWFR